MARRNKGRPVHGLIILDKPAGLTSNRALQVVKRRLSAAKAGHTGALDPLATGVLPLCFGEATKFSQILLEADKEYITRARLGQQTTTADAEGEILSERPVPRLTAESLELVMGKFRGAQKQIPSMYSALKHHGVPLYKLARQGQEVEREARDIVIHELEVLAVSLPFVDLRVKCSKGTYIRNLVEDIGAHIGCGAHVAELRRTQSGPFLIKDAVSLDVFESGLEDRELTEILRPVDAAVADFPEISLNDQESGSIIHGQTVKISPLENPARPGEPLRLYWESGTERKFLGMGEMSDTHELKSIRLLNPDVL